MADVEFSEEEGLKTAFPSEIASGTGGTLHRVIIRFGLAKDETGANIVLGAIGVLAIAAAVLLFTVF